MSTDCCLTTCSPTVFTITVCQKNPSPFLYLSTEPFLLAVDFMGGDAKSPQHTVVHPMYVSYSCIPSSANGTLTPKHTNNYNNNNDKYSTTTSNYNQPQLTTKLPSIPYQDVHQQPSSGLPSPFNNYNNNHISNHHYIATKTPFDSNLNHKNQTNAANPGRGFASFGDQNYRVAPTRTANDWPGVRYTELTTTGEVNDNFTNNELNESPDIRFNNNYQQFTNNFNNNNNRSYYSNDLSSPPPPPPPLRSAQAAYDRYQPPSTYAYVARSPILNRSGSSSSRRRLDQSPGSSQRLPGSANFVDKIRDAPPGYVATQCGSIQRTKSQDRLGQRRQSNRSGGGGRPRSYCDRISTQHFVEEAEYHT